MAFSITNPADLKKIKDTILEIDSSLTRIEGERDFIKEAVKDLSDKFTIPKRTISKMAKVYHKQNYDEQAAEQEEFDDAYTAITQIKRAGEPE